VPDALSNGLFDPLRAQQADPLDLNTMNTLALGPLYAPRDPGTMVGAGAGPVAAPARGYSLEPVHPRTGRPVPDVPDPYREDLWGHGFAVKDPDGTPVGLIGAKWNPDTQDLFIKSFESEGGPNSLGLGAIRQIHDALLARFPGIQTLSGQRITGAVSADRNSGTGPGRAATLTIPQPGQTPGS
jgi:hypothetical protein